VRILHHRTWGFLLASWNEEFFLNLFPSRRTSSLCLSLADTRIKLNLRPAPGAAHPPIGRYRRVPTKFADGSTVCHDRARHFGYFEYSSTPTFCSAIFLAAVHQLASQLCMSYKGLVLLLPFAAPESGIGLTRTTFLILCAIPLLPRLRTGHFCPGTPLPAYSG
jgi:hypothetical protein